MSNFLSCKTKAFPVLIICSVELNDLSSFGTMPYLSAQFEHLSLQLLL